MMRNLALGSFFQLSNSFVSQIWQNFMLMLFYVLEKFLLLVDNNLNGLGLASHSIEKKFPIVCGVAQ